MEMLIKTNKIIHWMFSIPTVWRKDLELGDVSLSQPGQAGCCC